MIELLKHSGANKMKTMILMIMIMFFGCGDGTASKRNQIIEEDILCPEERCSNHGTCYVVDDQKECRCDSGYIPFNLSCVLENNPCLNVDCSVNGFCVVKDEVATCSCYSGYHAEGLSCVKDLVVDLCDAVSCDYWESCDSVDGLCKVADGYCEGDCEGDNVCDENHRCVAPQKDPIPTRYKADRSISPMNAYMFDQLQTIINNNPGKNESVFIKVGASGTVSTKLLYCVDSEQSRYTLDLNGEDDLMAMIDYFQTIRFDGESSFNRETLAAMVGRTAYWVMDGDPSPFDQEVSALNPRFALINYGTNEMGSNYAATIFPFFRNLERLIQHSLSLGIIPMLTGLNPRTDKESATYWVEHFNDITRGLAEKYQIPYLDLFYLAHPLIDQGMGPDGLHGNAYISGNTQPCIFTPEGLGFNYNVRNLYTLRMLHQLKNGLDHPESVIDEPEDIYRGSGTFEDPIVIDRFPFTHHDDTSKLQSSRFNEYPCGSNINEGGGEIYYQLDLEARTALRVMIFDDNDTTDVDIHILKDTLAADSCIDRAHQIIEGTYTPGRYYVVVDTYMSGGAPKSGAYTLLLSMCKAGDTDCE